ncbi:MAG TPA: thiamine diphosphokinase [Candidatus Limnocylindrales bacterium]
MIKSSSLRVVVLADGRRPSREGLDAAWPGWDAGIELVVAADGGALLAESLGLRIDRWVGDGDSVGVEGLAKIRAAGIPIALAAADKDETDTEMAILDAIEAGAGDITILGALGGSRIDHVLANIALLGHPAIAQAGVSIRILDPAARIVLLTAPEREGGPARLELGGPFPGLVSLIPFGGDVAGVTTEGLRYPLHDEALSLGVPRGISNVREGPAASVTIRSGRLLIVETPATLFGT